MDLHLFRSTQNKFYPYGYDFCHVAICGINEEISVIKKKQY